MDNTRKILVICPDCGIKNELSYDIDFVIANKITRFNLEEECGCGMLIVAQVHMEFVRDRIDKLTKMVINPKEEHTFRRSDSLVVDQHRGLRNG